MSFSLLGTSCKPQTIACTSNTKFLPLLSPIYENQNVSMMQYPGHINKIPQDKEDKEDKEDNNSPEIIKSCKSCS
jgi:hypothetical protein